MKARQYSLFQPTTTQERIIVCLSAEDMKHKERMSYLKKLCSDFLITSKPQSLYIELIANTMFVISLALKANSSDGDFGMTQEALAKIGPRIIQDLQEMKSELEIHSAIFNEPKHSGMKL